MTGINQLHNLCCFNRRLLNRFFEIIAHFAKPTFPKRPLSNGKPAFPSYSGPCAVARNVSGLAGSLEIRVKSALRACRIHSAAAATIVARAGSNDISSSNASESAHMGILVPPNRPTFRSRAEKEFRLIHSCFASLEAVSKVGARRKMISKRQKYKESYISYLRTHASRMLELSRGRSVQRADS